MPIHGLKRLSAIPSTAGAITRRACAVLGEAGVELAPLLAQAGLNRQQVDDDHARISVRSQIKLIELAADAMQDELLGFHLARDFDLREMGLLYYVLASSEKLGDSLHRAVRYSTIANEGIVLSFRDEADAAMTFTYVGVDRHSDRHQIEFWLTSLARICRQLTGRHLIPTHANVVHDREMGAVELNTFFGCDVAFGAHVDEVVFPGHVNDLPVVSGDPYLNELLIKYCEDALSDRRGRRGTLRSELENEIVQLLPHGKTQMGTIARRLGMSKRTLARRLSSEGLTFAGILADLRVDLAKRHLTDEDLAISQIAWLLGYQEVSAFTHAFKRRTGKTPKEARSEKGGFLLTRG
jgi:AraC-like DNA-binding protein